VVSDVAVVVVSYNSAAVIGDLLDSVPAALDGLSGMVVVVDNGSSDDTVAIVRARGDCLVVEAENRGYAAGINRGVVEAPRTAAIAVLNPDLVLSAGALRVLVDALDQPETGIVAPRIVNPDGSLFQSLRHAPSVLNTVGLSFIGNPRFSEYVTDPTQYSQPGIVDWALGAALVVSRECHERLGGWDETFFLYSEETDLCLRARDHGMLTRYEPGATVMHIGGGSGSSPRSHSMQIVNLVRLYRRRHGLPASAAYMVLVTVRELKWWRRHPDNSRAAVRALLRPSQRPAELKCTGYIPC